MDENENKRKLKKKQIIEDLDKPKRKRGRPPKVKIADINLLEIQNIDDLEIN